MAPTKMAMKKAVPAPKKQEKAPKKAAPAPKKAAAAPKKAAAAPKKAAPATKKAAPAPKKQEKKAAPKKATTAVVKTAEKPVAKKAAAKKASKTQGAVAKKGEQYMLPEEVSKELDALIQQVKQEEQKEQQGVSGELYYESPEGETRVVQFSQDGEGGAVQFHDDLPLAEYASDSADYAEMADSEAESEMEQEALSEEIEEVRALLEEQFPDREITDEDVVATMVEADMALMMEEHAAQQVGQLCSVSGLKKQKHLNGKQGFVSSVQPVDVQPGEDKFDFVFGVRFLDEPHVEHAVAPENLDEFLPSQRFSKAASKAAKAGKAKAVKAEEKTVSFLFPETPADEAEGAEGAEADLAPYTGPVLA